jgi:hypothetical protein
VKPKDFTARFLEASIVSIWKESRDPVHRWPNQHDCPCATIFCTDERGANLATVPLDLRFPAGVHEGTFSRLVIQNRRPGAPLDWFGPIGKFPSLGTRPSLLCLGARNISESGRGAPCGAPHRVAGGGHPPPAPTDRGVRISCTTLFGS